MLGLILNFAKQNVKLWNLGTGGLKVTCKDCIHYCLCNYEEICHYDIDTIKNAKDCSFFRDRSRFVELPCKVGDTVYFNNVHFKYAKVIAIYIDASGGMFDLKISTNVETVSGYESFINKDYTFEDIGQRIFLTREAAEQALKERENSV